MDNSIIITIQQLLIGRNPDFDKAQKIKLVRHKDNRPVLEVLPLQISDAVAIDRELLWKRKFCTHDFGYNTN